MRRGKATSGEPICSGMTAFANPANIGVANNSIMIVPCTVNSWLYCSALTICRPGRASSARISMRQHPGQQEESERGDHVEVADDLVVRGRQPAHEPDARTDPSVGDCLCRRGFLLVLRHRFPVRPGTATSGFGIDGGASDHGWRVRLAEEAPNFVSSPAQGVHLMTYGTHSDPSRRYPIRGRTVMLKFSSDVMTPSGLCPYCPPIRGGAVEFSGTPRSERAEGCLLKILYY